MVLENLQPPHVWEIFESVLAATPRSSKKEEKIRKAIKRWVAAQKKKGFKLTITEDEIGNLCVKKGATKGKDKVPPIILQAHMDMVCETDRKGGFDFDNKAITIQIQDNNEWVDADGTTLGADNGIGVALSLGLLVDKEVEHGPLEVLLTVDEETGLTGAFELDINKHQIKSKHLINVDSEEVGAITMGSSGGGDTVFSRKLRRFNPKPEVDKVFYELKVEGLRGGHSGGEIHLNRGSGHKIISRVLTQLLEKVKINLCTWNGGSKHNAISRESTIVFATNTENAEITEKLLKEQEKELKTHYNTVAYRNQEAIEPNFEMKWKKTKLTPYSSYAVTKEIISTANIVHNGVIEFSPSMKGLTQTSNNFAIVRTLDSSLEFVLSTRSSVDSDLESFRTALRDIGKFGGWKVKQLPSYPGWVPDPTGEFLQYVKKQYEELLEEEVKLKAVHGGLETGVIGAMVPGIQMVSIGPRIQNPHTPAERLNIEDVGVLYELLKRIVKNFK
ncbi:MAG: beta-Ala-His dipeptidase [Promethearchaeota archaeon]